VARYLIRVDRLLSEELTSAFPQLSSSVQPVQTVLTGYFTDAQELSGVLNFLGEMGVDILELVRIPDKSADG
jgi:pyridoxal/pyridoxine/pyridoxamine kinase